MYNNYNTFLYKFIEFSRHKSLLIRSVCFQAEEDANRKQIPEAEAKRNEDSNEDQPAVRQRHLESNSNIPESEEQIVTDILLEASIQRSNK